jgi:hypothetical protein
MTTVIDSTKKKFAVLVGINYYGTSGELRGCINDVNNLKSILINRFGYLPENVLTLTDNTTDASRIPNRQNILNSFSTLVSKAENEDFTELWFSYSGHGTYYTDASNDETDGRDELLCPVDYATSGFITDDVVYSSLASKVPASAQLFCLMDCCHSGTILDLPYLYSTSLSTNNTHQCAAQVISISGCRDDQTSADAYMGSDYEGAMTWSFINALSNANFNIKLVDLVQNMRVLLSNGFTQVPMLAMTSPDDVDLHFVQPSAEPEPEPEVSTDPRPIKFTMSTDYWYWESSWNVWSAELNKNVFPSDQRFSSRYQQTITTAHLKPSTYKLIIRDTYGDGGVSALVQDGLNDLIRGTMNTGRLAEVTFVV